MNKIVDELKKTKVFYIATIEGNQPRVRPFSSVTEFESNLYICTNNQKEVYKQLINNPNIEICGMEEDGSWIRISGVAVKDDRDVARKAMLDDPTGPNGLYKIGDGIFEVFKLENIKCFKYQMNSGAKEIK